MIRHQIKTIEQAADLYRELIDGVRLRNTVTFESLFDSGAMLFRAGHAVTDDLRPKRIPSRLRQMKTP